MWKSGCTQPVDIPGSFFRREGRPSTEAILACRLIDRPLRPTFVKGLRNEVQVVVTVAELESSGLYDVVAINGASAATQLSGLPVSGPVGGVRIALIADDSTQGPVGGVPDPASSRAIPSSRWSSQVAL